MRQRTRNLIYRTVLAVAVCLLPSLADAGLLDNLRVRWAERHAERVANATGCSVAGVAPTYSVAPVFNSSTATVRWTAPRATFSRSYAPRSTVRYYTTSPSVGCVDCLDDVEYEGYASTGPVDLWSELQQVKAELRVLERRMEVRGMAPAAEESASDQAATGMATVPARSASYQGQEQGEPCDCACGADCQCGADCFCPVGYATAPRIGFAPAGYATAPPAARPSVTLASL